MKKNFINDFDRVVRVMESCISESQLKVARNYFNLFLNKYSDKMSDNNFLSIETHYNKLEKSKVAKLNKK